MKFRPMIAAALCCLSLAAPITSTAQTPTAEQQQLRARLAQGVARLQFLVGDWTVVQSHPTGSGWVERPPITADFKPSMNGLYVVGDFDSGAFTYEMVFSYDAAKGEYRVASRDDVSGLIDVYQGDFDASGELKLSNLASGTHYLVGGVRHHNRLTFTSGTDGWQVLIEVTRDDGVTWAPQGRAVARKRA